MTSEYCEALGHCYHEGICCECGHGNLAPEIPISRMVDEFSMESKPYAVEKVDFEEAKRLLKEFRDITSNRKSWLELQALLGRLP